MRKMINIGCVIVVLVLLGACGAATVQEVVTKTRLEWVGDDALKPDPRAEAILVDAFRQSGVEWDAKQLENAIAARDAIRTQFGFLREKLTLDGTISYYTFKGSFEFIQYNYRTLEEILDDRVAAGALDEKAEVIYGYVRRDINAKLERQRIKIAEAEADINGKATEANIEQIRGVYDFLQPLISTVL